MFAATRFRLGGIALLVLVFACAAAPAQAADVTISNPQVTEPDAGTSDAIFTVTLTSVEAADLTFNYTTLPGLPADPEDDFLARTGEVTFLVGETSKTITVPVVGDTVDEPTEYFDLELTGQGLAEAVTGTAAIIDDDAVLSIGDVTLNETSAGTTSANFTVSASNTDSGEITVSYATADGSATSPADYTTTSDTLTFAEFGELSQTISVPVVGDTTDEPHETFLVNLTAPANASIADAQGEATILDDDGVLPPSPDATINDVSVTEGNTGTAEATFTVTLSGATTGTATIDFSTAGGTATQPADFTLTSGTLTFVEGDLTETITVPVVGDTFDEPNETFLVNLTGASTNVAITDAQGVGTILNDDVEVLPSGPDFSDPIDDGGPDVQARVLRGLSLAPSARRVGRGSLLRLNGILRASGGPASCRSRQKIAIQRRKLSGGRFQTFEVAVTAKNGSFKTSTRPVRTYQYRARVSQTTRCMGATSKTAKVVVRKQPKGGSARR